MLDGLNILCVSEKKKTSLRIHILFINDKMGKMNLNYASVTIFTC